VKQSFYCACFVIFAVLTALQAQAQNGSPAQAAPAMPADSAELMRLAAQVNGLNSASLKPWHLKATYEISDDEGKPKGQGTFEEWWAGPEKYKISYASTSFSQVRYRNGPDTRMTGDAKWAPATEAMVEQYLVHPLFPSIPAADGFSDSDTELGGAHFRCLHLRLRARPLASAGSTFSTLQVAYPVYCFGRDLPAIRVEAPSRDFVVFFNEIVRFDTQYVAKQIQVKKAGLPLLNIDLTELGAIANVQEADFAPPSEAVPAPEHKISVSPDVMARSRISSKAPEYPYEAKAARIEGVVTLEATITKTGSISNLQVLTGHHMLWQAAIDAVKTWRYRPYLLNGEPVEVETQVSIFFQLGQP
jgi:TonB family protein